jgi:hypothetical protein
MTRLLELLAVGVRDTPVVSIDFGTSLILVNNGMTDTEDGFIIVYLHQKII